MTSAAPLPCAGQIALKILADLVRWSCGALGRVPRIAQRRVIPFFWPTRASSCHHSSIGVPRGSALRIRSEERRVGNECVSRVDLGGRRSLKKKITPKRLQKYQ